MCGLLLHNVMCWHLKLVKKSCFRQIEFPIFLRNKVRRNRINVRGDFRNPIPECSLLNSSPPLTDFHPSIQDSSFETAEGNRLWVELLETRLKCETERSFPANNFPLCAGGKIVLANSDVSDHLDAFIRNSFRSPFFVEVIKTSCEESFALSRGRIVLLLN